MKICIDRKIGCFKPINGASNFDSRENGNFFDFGFPSVRLHDQDYPRPFCVDIAAIFPNSEEDENNPENYDFRHTDLIISKLVENDVEVIYRLGNSIDHTPFKRLSCVPKDFEKWARIAEHIIAHYREGWANGFYYKSLRYWEIWNEPDLIYLGLNTMWQGSEDQFFELYSIASRHLKTRFPDILVGGYGAARTKAPFFEHFLEMAHREKLPLDFFSWHRYGSEIEELRDQARRVRVLLDKYGFTSAKSILDEWCYTENDWFGKSRWSEIENNSTLFESFNSRMRGSAGAAYFTACMTMMLDESVDIAHIYDCQTHTNFSVLYDSWQRLTKTAKAILAFNKMAKMDRVYTECEVNDVYLSAGHSSDSAVAIISAFECKGSEEVVELKGCLGFKVGVRVIDDYFSGEEISSFTATEDTVKIPVSIRPYTVIILELTKNG